jgi:hypothetical protein
MSAAPNPIPQGKKSGSEQTLLQLTVTTGDESAEIVVINNDLSLAAPRALGSLIVNLLPGIYKVRVRTGFASTDKLIVLRDGPKTVPFGEMEFSSPLPLPKTANTHEYHEQAAEEQSQKVHVTAGLGSAVFIFVREWTEKGNGLLLDPTLNPSAGLTLKSLDGTPVTDIAEKSAKFAADFPGDPWAACNIVLNPGPYLLCVKTLQGEFQQLIVAPPNWHVHAFLTLRNYCGEGQRQERRADLATAGISLSQSLQFKSANKSARLVELARLGLAQGRRVLSAITLGEILAGKFEDPMLGIFGGHLLLMEDPVNLDTLKIVVNNLRMMLGNDHPDVEALATRLNPPGTGYQVKVPPMLRKSWQLMLDATADQRCTVVRDSFAASILNRTRSGEPWLLWTEGAPAQLTESDLEAVLKEYLFGRQVAIDKGAFQNFFSDTIAHATRIIVDIAQAVFGNTTLVGSPGAPKGTKPKSGKPEGSKPEVTKQTEAIALPHPVSPETLKQLINNIGVPRYYVEDMLQKLNINIRD